MFRKKKTLALALGSGGAKGMAHVGALQALEECGVHFSAVAGTSIGSIVGAFYAKGYSPRDISELLRRLDYKSMAISVLTAGSNLSVRNLIDSMLDESCFSDLTLPFAAVATEISNGEEKVFRSGRIADAVLASSAMPPFFKGVEIDGKMYMDGAFVNAVPADVARTLGGDFVIGISLSPAKSYERTEFVLRNGEKKVCMQKGVHNCDFLLEPDLSAYGATDVFSAPVMYDIGYECAMRHADEILSALRANAVRF